MNPFTKLSGWIASQFGAGAMDSLMQTGAEIFPGAVHARGTASTSQANDVILDGLSGYGRFFALGPDESTLSGMFISVASSDASLSYGAFWASPDGNVYFQTGAGGPTPSGTFIAPDGTITAPNLPIAGSFSGSGTATTAFTVTIGVTMANSSYKVNVTPTAALAAAVFYISAKSTTTFTVTYLAGLTGTVTFDWSVFP